ncbi:MAG: hypothetical protein KDC08_11935, partial [Actinobacteria bacterium]|nr:hypothetical protein [Actinomycetota bacterium]
RCCPGEQPLALMAVRVDTDRVQHRLVAVDHDRRVGSLVRIDSNHEHRMVLSSWMEFATVDTPDAWLMPFLFRATPQRDLAGQSLRSKANLTAAGHS